MVAELFVGFFGVRFMEIIHALMFYIPSWMLIIRAWMGIICS